LQATAQCAATFVRAVGRPNNDPLDRELHRCIAEEHDVPADQDAVTRRIKDIEAIGTQRYAAMLLLAYERRYIQERARLSLLHLLKLCH
jgi:hypothetical protein